MKRQPSRYHRAGWNQGDHGHPPFGHDDLPATIPGELTAAGDWVPHGSAYALYELTRPWADHPRTAMARDLFGADLELELGLRAGFAALDRWALANDLAAAHRFGACPCYTDDPAAATQLALELEAVA